VYSGRGLYMVTREPFWNWRGGTFHKISKSPSNLTDLFVLGPRPRDIREGAKCIALPRFIKIGGEGIFLKTSDHFLLLGSAVIFRGGGECIDFLASKKWVGGSSCHHQGFSSSLVHACRRLDFLWNDALARLEGIDICLTCMQMRLAKQLCIS